MFIQNRHAKVGGMSLHALANLEEITLVTWNDVLDYLERGENGSASTPSCGGCGGCGVRKRRADE